MFPNRQIFLFIVLLFLLLTSQVCAQRADKVIMKNGDHITGEIKRLEVGILVFKTDDMGTSNIEWDKIRQVISKDIFDVELQDGRVFYGSLDTANSSNQMLIKSNSGDKLVLRDYVVSIVPIKNTFWDIIDGYVKFGFDFSKDSKVGKLTLGGNAKYRTKFYNTILEINSIITGQEQSSPSRDQDVTLTIQRFLEHKWFLGSAISLEQKTGFGLNLRTAIRMGSGYNIIQSNQSLLYSLFGLSFNRESFIDSTESTFNLESIIIGQYQLYIYDHPKTRLTTYLKIFPSLTNWGRIRSDYKIELDWEVIIDLYWELSFDISYDNKPTGNASTTDYKINTAFKYEF